MKTWSDLQEYLQKLMGDKVKVYYQPPENVKLKYPCIVLELSNALIHYADNNPYFSNKRQSITLMCLDADNDEYVNKLLTIPMCTFDRRFINDRIVHDIFSIYYQEDTK